MSISCSLPTHFLRVRALSLFDIFLGDEGHLHAVNNFYECRVLQGKPENAHMENFKVLRKDKKI